MTLDDHIAQLLDGFRREMALRLNERTNTLASEIGQAAAAAHAEAARDRDSILGQARAEFSTQLEQALATARADAMRERSTALAAANAEADARLRAAVDDARREAEEAVRQSAERQLTETRARERQAELACLDRVAETIRRFDQARTLTDVLELLGEAVAHEAPRTALFLARGGRLAGWRASGFGPGVDPRAVDVPNVPSSLLWSAISAGAAVGTGPSLAGDRLLTPFGALPDDAAAFAVPVRVGGEAVAVIYADDAADGPREVPSSWPEAVEVLARHAARCLEVVTLSRAATVPAPSSPHPSRPMAQAERPAAAPRAEDDESARRYARLLVSEIKLYHEAAVTQGRQDHNLALRLRSEIERARRLFDERVPAEIRSRADYFEQELVRTLANGDASLLGPA